MLYWQLIVLFQPSRSVLDVKLILIFFGGISSNNFGAVLVVRSKEKLVTAKEALAAGPQPRPRMETIIISLMYLALHSDKIELEVFFCLFGLVFEQLQTMFPTLLDFLVLCTCQVSNIC